MLATLVLAGVIYHFTSETVAQQGSVTVGGRVWAEGNAYRLELDPRPDRPHQFDAAISTDGGQTVTWINRARNTYETRTQSAGARSSLLFHLAGVGRNTAGKPRLTHDVLGLDVVSGRAATKHRITLVYEARGRVDGTVVKGNVFSEVFLWTDDVQPSLPFERPVQTGFPHIDARIAEIYARLRGMALKSEMTVTRIIEGGPPIREKTSTVIDELAIGEVEASLFEVR